AANAAPTITVAIVPTHQPAPRTAPTSGAVRAVMTTATTAVTSGNEKGPTRLGSRRATPIVRKDRNGRRAAGRSADARAATATPASATTVDTENASQTWRRSLRPRPTIEDPSKAPQATLNGVAAPHTSQPAVSRRPEV